jgi:serine O-acetyltransferase
MTWAETTSHIRKDYFRIKGDFGANLFTVFLFALHHKTFRPIVTYRMYRYCLSGGLIRRRILKLPIVLLHRWSCLAVAMEISPYAQIGPGVRLLHGFGIVLLDTAIIEKNVTLAHGVVVGHVGTLESPQTQEKTGYVQEGSYIGPYSMIWARVGRDSAVAAHSVVLEDLPDKTFAAGQPAKVKSEIKATFVQHPV